MLKKRELQRINYMHSPTNRASVTKLIARTMGKLHKKYDMKQCNLTSIIIDHLIFNKNTHLVSIFKDHMIYDYKDEFLKREYSMKESLERVPKFASFYKNYLQFFCKPLFRDLYLNEQIQEHGKNRAELFYNQNFKGKFEEGELIQEDVIETNVNVSKTLINKTIFNTFVKENIDNNPIITHNNSLFNEKKKPKGAKEQAQASMTLNNETVINDSGLLAGYSNEQSIISMMTQLKKKSNREPKNNHNNPNTKAITISQPYQNSNSKNNKSNLIAYTKLCKEHLMKSNTLKFIQKLNTKSQVQVKDISKTRSRNLSTKIDFKTYNPNSKKSLLKTQNIENIINRIITQQVNGNLHSKNVYSIDHHSNNSRKKIPMISYKTKSLCNLTKKNRGNSNKMLYPSNKISSPNHFNANSTNDLKNSIQPNNDLMKITLAFLMDNNNNSTVKHTKNSYSNSRFPGGVRQIQNVNININNQININNNVHLNDNVSPKQIPSKLLKNEGVEVNIQSNLKKILNATKGVSRNKDSDNFTRNNENASFKSSLWSNTITNKNLIYNTCWNFDKLKTKKSCSRNANSNGENIYSQLSKSPTKTITSIPKSKISFLSNQSVKRIPAIKYTQTFSLNKLSKK